MFAGVLRFTNRNVAADRVVRRPDRAAATDTHTDADADAEPTVTLKPTALSRRRSAVRDVGLDVSSDASLGRRRVARGLRCSASGSSGM